MATHDRTALSPLELTRAALESTVCAFAPLADARLRGYLVLPERTGNPR
jgi:hypothetical protein